MTNTHSNQIPRQYSLSVTRQLTLCKPIPRCNNVHDCPNAKAIEWVSGLAFWFESVNSSCLLWTLKLAPWRGEDSRCCFAPLLNVTMPQGRVVNVCCKWASVITGTEFGRVVVRKGKGCNPVKRDKDYPQINWIGQPLQPTWSIQAHKTMPVAM